MEEKPPVRKECSGLPKGWYREIVIRKGGVSAGRSDVYYYSPDGKKCRSKPQLEKELGGVDLTDFDFRNGTFCKRSRRRTNQQSFTRDLNGTIQPSPVRQSTKSFSKQPVSYYPSTEDPSPQKKRKIEQSCKHTKIEKDKPKQLFWEKRLQGITAVDASDGRKLDSFNLSKAFKVVGPGMDEKGLLHALMAKIHSNTSIRGQHTSIVALEKHPEIWINVDQPPCAPFTISDGEVKSQEERVAKLRRRLAEALSDYDHIKLKILSMQRPSRNLLDSF